MTFPATLMIRIQVCVYVSLLHIGLPQSISAKQWWHKGVSGANRGDYGAIVRICILLRNSKTLQKERQGSKPFYQKTTRKMRTHNWKGVWKRPHIPFFCLSFYLEKWCWEKGCQFFKGRTFLPDGIGLCLGHLSFGIVGWVEPFHLQIFFCISWNNLLLSL